MAFYVFWVIARVLSNAGSTEKDTEGFMDSKENKWVGS